ncbi:MAG TPA: hypothetical protein VKD91_08285, partial [Pyrinomonadaceae bacterium]|nr:hypothetical protein [Pyrinomonadaceae bacterium]
MKILRSTIALLFVLTLVAPSQLAFAAAQDQPPAVTPLMRGYRTGYSDGYPAGVSDQNANAPKEYRNKLEYDRGDRAYNPNWGSLEDYRDGYRQGFEVGYNAGYDRKPFDSTIPSDIKRRAEDSAVQYPVDQNKAPVDQNKAPVDQNKAPVDQNKAPVDQNKAPIEQNKAPGGTDNGAPADQPGNGVSIPRDSIMRVVLMNEISTDISQPGDRFQARVVDPKTYDGAILEGHIAQLKRPGKTKGIAELQLAFEQIRFSNGRASKFSAQVIEVIPNGGTDAGKVDSEGGIKGQDSTKGDLGKIGGAAGIGAVIGLIFGGGSGAAV